MPQITFSEEDLLRNRVLEVGWYRVRIDKVGEKPSSGDNPETTRIYPISGTVLFNAENGNKQDIEGTPTPPSWNFNDNPKARGFMVGYFESFGVEVNAGKSFELKATEGRELDVFIEQDTYQGRIVNRINHKYRKPRTA